MKMKLQLPVQPWDHARSEHSLVTQEWHTCLYSQKKFSLPDSIFKVSVIIFTRHRKSRAGLKIILLTRSISE